jgi:hypothetical protein
MFMRYLGGGVGHCTEWQEDVYDGENDDDMWIDEDKYGSPSTLDEMQTDVDADEELGHDSDNFDGGSSNGDSEEDLGPKDGEDEQEDEEADFDDYGAL